MNGLYKFVLTVSLLLVVEAKQKTRSEKSDECAVKFPDGFFCSSICQTWPVLKGNTFMCFVSNDGEYHRVVGRNPTYGVWRFYKVDETTDLKSLCQTTLNGDKFYLNNTETICPTNESNVTTVKPKTDKTTQAPEDPESSSEKEDVNSSTESTKKEKRLSVRDIITKINEKVSELFPNSPGKEEEAPPEEPESRSANRRSDSKKNRKEKEKDKESHKTLPMDEICQLITTDICDNKKIVTCDTDGKCCWMNFDSEKVTPDNMKKYDECYKGLGFAMDSIL